MSDPDLPMFDRVRGAQPPAELRRRVLDLAGSPAPLPPPRRAPRLTPWLLGAALWLALLAVANAWLADVDRRTPHSAPPDHRLAPVEASRLQQLSLRGGPPRAGTARPTANSWLRLRRTELPRP